MKRFFILIISFITVLSQESVKFCAPGFEICKNDGLCLVVDNQNLLCICTAGFKGIKYNVMKRSINEYLSFYYNLRNILRRPEYYHNDYNYDKENYNINN